MVTVQFSALIRNKFTPQVELSTLLKEIQHVNFYTSKACMPDIISLHHYGWLCPPTANVTWVQVLAHLVEIWA